MSWKYVLGVSEHLSLRPDNKLAYPAAPSEGMPLGTLKVTHDILLVGFVDSCVVMLSVFLVRHSDNAAL